MVARRFVHTSLLAFAALLLAGCWELNNPVDPLAENFQGYRVYKLLDLSFERPSLELIEGARASVAVFATYEDGSSVNVSSDVTVTVGETSVADVDYGSGTLLINALRPGTTLVTARYSGLSTDARSLSVEVLQAPLSRIEISPASRTIPTGATAEFRAVGVDSSGGRKELTEGVTWTLDGNGVVGEIADNGSFTVVGTEALRPGADPAVVTATVVTTDGTTLTDTASVYGSEAVLESISVTFDDEAGIESIPLGRRVRLRAFGRYSDGETYPITHASGAVWSSSDESAIEVSNDPSDWGTAEAIGRSKMPVTLAVALGGVASGDESLSLAVSPPALDRIEIVPPRDPIYHGLTIDFTVRGFLSDGSGSRELEEIQWSVPEDGAAISIVDGRLTADGHGDARVVARYQNLEAEIIVPVLPVVTSFSLDAAATEIGVGARTELFATAAYSDGSIAAVGPDDGAKWTITTVGEGAIAAPVLTEDGRVLVAGVAAGVSTVTVRYTPDEPRRPTFSDSIDITVLSATIESIRIIVTPESAVHDESGILFLERDGEHSSIRLVALARYADGKSSPITTGVTWSTSDPSVVGLSTGQFVEVSAKGYGTARVTASLDGTAIADDLSVTVDPELDELRIDLPAKPKGGVLPVGAEIPIRAIAEYDDGEQADRSTDVTWSVGENASIELRQDGDGSGYVLVALEEGSTGAIGATLGHRRATHPGIEIGPPRIVGNLEIDGPLRVAVGTTAVFSARALLTNGPGAVDSRLVEWRVDGPDFVSIDQDGTLHVAAGQPVGADGKTVDVLVITTGYNGAEGKPSLERRRSVSLVRELSSLRIAKATVRRPNGSAQDSRPISPGRLELPAGSLLSVSVIAEFTDGTAESVQSTVDWSWKGTGARPGRLSTAGLPRGTFRGTAPGNVDVYGSYTYGPAGMEQSRSARVHVSIRPPRGRARARDRSGDNHGAGQERDQPPD